MSSDIASSGLSKNSDNKSCNRFWLISIDIILPTLHWFVLNLNNLLNGSIIELKKNGYKNIKIKFVSGAFEIPNIIWNYRSSLFFI